MKKFNEKIKSNTLSHAIIISGDDEAKKNAAILSALEYFCCKNENSPCENCNICRKTKNFTNPDIFIIDNGDKIISIDEIRSIRKDSYVPPNESFRKVYVIKNASNMNAFSSNALLKILEEPPSHVSFVLETKDENALLDTILSRCVVYRFNAPNEVFDEKILEYAYDFIKKIKNEADFLSIDFKKITKNEFRSVMSAMKHLLKDSILVGCRKEQVDEISKEIFLNMTYREINNIYDICVSVENLCEFNVNTTNLAYYFITEVKK